jgi:hypothetical protein
MDLALPMQLVAVIPTTMDALMRPHTALPVPIVVAITNPTDERATQRRLIDASPNAPPAVTTKYIRLGAFDPAEGENLIGLIDDVRIYEGPLEATQIAQVFAGQD